MASPPPAGMASFGGRAAREKEMAGQCVLFCEETKATGEKYFGESADNLTGVLIDLREVCRR